MNKEALKMALKAQILKPARAVVNSEAAFVKDRLNKAGEFESAKIYWNYVCSRHLGGIPSWSDDEIEQMQDDLNMIDKGQTMPAWGTYGT